MNNERPFVPVGLTEDICHMPPIFYDAAESQVTAWRERQPSSTITNQVTYLLTIHSPSTFIFLALNKDKSSMGGHTDDSEDGLS